MFLHSAYHGRIGMTEQHRPSAHVVVDVVVAIYIAKMTAGLPIAVEWRKAIRLQFRPPAKQMGTTGDALLGFVVEIERLRYARFRRQAERITIGSQRLEGLALENRVGGSTGWT